MLTACGSGGGSNGGTQTASATPASSPAPASDPASAPAAVIAPTGSIFYGMNGHVNAAGAYATSSPQQQLAQLKDLNVSMYRNDVSSQADAVKLASVAQMMQPSGVTVYPVLLQVVKDFTDENTAYQKSYTLAQQIVGVQKYAYYEVTNELAPQCLVGWVDGVHSTDYDNSCFQIARGIIRGMIAGIKSVDPAGKIIIGGNTWMHYGFDQMLANGTQPDGTGGHPVVTWDITAWHWYSEQGDMRHACGGSGCYDVIGTLKSFGKPIWINEVGIRPDFPGTPDQAAAFLGSDMLGTLLSIAPQYDIESLQMYELYDDPPTGQGPYGVMLNDGTTQKPEYAAFKSFIAAHPQ
ncbi:lipopolysaccharide biosynthesis protein [Caballeronia sp. LZ035]|uniref:lipopolysaccharide biosynthesis protein n=1 Tax=Caballeronia sp. LZ035 TaxID=3038568 RepID=UPI002859FC68|nr:lipopolysaccharide biosynthesis protein [Caballeronia sp. LZ035]MDR5758506.1 lipopolysaccharide biosynthesis protein [Caballeronia sp. LZ035]